MDTATRVRKAVRAGVNSIDNVRIKTIIPGSESFDTYARQTELLWDPSETVSYLIEAVVGALAWVKHQRGRSNYDDASVFRIFIESGETSDPDPLIIDPEFFIIGPSPDSATVAGDASNFSMSNDVIYKFPEN